MKKSKRPRLSDLIPDEEKRKKVEEALYSNEPLLGPNGVFTELLQDLVNASLEGELDHHLEETKKGERNNRRNGHVKKQVKTTAGKIEVSTPRDRDGKFQPILLPKRQRELKGGLEDVILTFYAQGNSNEDIYRMLKKIYGIEYSSTAISRITERVWPMINEWQQRALQACYAILYLDGIYFRVLEDGRFVDKTVYSVYGVDVAGNRDVLGIYLDKRECANQWGLVLEDLKRRGVEDVFFVCVDGLPGFKNAIQLVFPEVIVNRCIVHKVRNSVRFVADKDYRPLCSDLRKVYTSANREQAAIALDDFEQKWGDKGTKISESWRKDWEELTAFLEYPEKLRKMLYTTNPVENLHRIIRKIVKAKGAWTSQRALTKQLYLALMQNEKSWKRKAHNWKAIQEHLELKFGERFSKRLLH